MKLNVSKEWCEKSARLEEGCSVQAGTGHTEPTITVHDGQGKNPTVLTRKQYDELCASGMMWEFHPDAPLNWPYL